MSRPTHTQSGRKISDDLTDKQAHFAAWMSDEGQALIGDDSITEAQRISKLLEAAFIAGSESIDVKEIEAVAGRAGFVACGAWLSNEDDGRHTVAEAADEYAERVKAGEV